MKKPSLLRSMLMALACVISLWAEAQTLPGLHDLSAGNYSFTAWDAASAAGTYPANSIFHFVGAEVTGGPTSADNASFNFGCVYNLTSRPRFLGKGTDGISMLNTGSSQFNDCVSGTATNRFVGVMVVGLNTIGLSNISVNWTGRTISGGGSSRDYRIILQYRVGNSGTWTNADDNTYFQFFPAAPINQNNGDSQVLSQTLPPVVNNEAEVYLRWLYYSQSGSGNRPELAIDDITISGGAAGCTIPDAITGLSATAGDASASLSWTNGACLDELLVIARNGSAVSFSPTGDGSAYTSSSLYGSGTEVSAGQFVVYKGTGTSANVTALTNGTTAHFAVYTRKGIDWTTGVPASATPSAIAFYWNGGDIAANPANGGTGTWNTADAWRQPTSTGAQATWADGNNARFEGVAGDVNIPANFSFTEAQFNTDNYTLTTTGATGRNLSGPIVIGSGNTLNLAPNDGGIGSGTMGVQSVSGGNALVIENDLATAGVARVNLTGPASVVSTPISITGSGTGLSGVVSTSAGAVINAPVSNGSATSATMLGATSGFDLTVNGVLSGNNIQISAGGSGGAGLVVLNAANNYVGATIINNSTTGVLRLGHAGALPASSEVQFGVGTNNHGSIDLNGLNVNIAALNTTGTGTSNGIANTNASAASLEISGAQATLYSGRIGQPGNPTNLAGANNQISLIRSGTGTTLLTGVLTYEGATDVNGGQLLFNTTLAASNQVNVNSGVLGGNGNIGVVNTTSGGTVNPGGTLTGSTTSALTAAEVNLNPSGKLTIEINNATGAAGAASGWDLLSTNIANVSSTSGSPFVIELVGFDNTNAPGAADNFNNATVYSWAVLSAATWNNFDLANFTLDASGFINNNPISSGTLSLALSGNDLVITFSPSAAILGCTNPLAANYDPAATEDDGSCILNGCTNPDATNYDPMANTDDGSCIIPGCMYSAADNYNPAATVDNATCTFSPCVDSCAGDLNGDGIIGFSDLSLFLSVYGQVCP